MPASQLRNAPLVHALAQVAFTPVLSIAECIPAIQRLLIQQGFPRFAESANPEVALTPGQPASASLKRRWDFIDRDQHWGIVLTESSLVLQTSKYPTIEPFLDRLRNAVDSIADTIRPALVERLGIRYIDLVRPDPGESFGQYVHSGLLGFPFRDSPQLGAQLRGFQTQSVAGTDVGALAIRSYLLPPNHFVPPDLQPTYLAYRQSDKDTQPALALDFDHFSIFRGSGGGSFDFDERAIIAHVTRLHSTVRAAFDAIALPHAMKRWGPWEKAAS